MRLFSSNCRTAAEILLTLAVLAFVTYDLVGRSGKPSSEAVSLSLEGKSSAVPEVQPAASGRFQTQISASINDSMRTPVCNALIATSNPQVIGGTDPEAIIFEGSSVCNTNPVVLASGNTSYAGLDIMAGSWLSLQNMYVPNPVITALSSKVSAQATYIAPGQIVVLTAGVGALTMDIGSYLEAVIPSMKGGCE